MANRLVQPLTELLEAASRGDALAHEKLWTVVYDELRLLARHQMADEALGRTLQPTALVHEAYFRLFPNGKAISPTGDIFSPPRRTLCAESGSMTHVREDDSSEVGATNRSA